MTGLPVLAGTLLPAREGDFQALWYFGIILFGMAVLVASAALYTLRAARPLWRAHQAHIAVLLVTVTTFLILMLVAMALVAVIGLARLPGTSGG